MDFEVAELWVLRLHRMYQSPYPLYLCVVMEHNVCDAAQFCLSDMLVERLYTG